MTNDIPWFLFRQNNSGGFFHTDANVCRQVYIQAETPDQANARAEELGIYFGGVASGLDCECCGNRWSRVDEYDRVTFGEHVTSIIEQIKHDAAAESTYWWTDPGAILHYANGERLAILKPTENLCSICGNPNPEGNSCECFDNGCQ